MVRGAMPCTALEHEEAEGEERMVIVSVNTAPVGTGPYKIVEFRPDEVDGAAVNEHTGLQGLTMRV